MDIKYLNRLSKKRAFTLVELLIVVIIIGILAGMMLLSAGSATDSAKAARILSDLRNTKSAALLYWADNRSWPMWFYGGEGYKDFYGKELPSKYSDLTTQGDGYWVGAMVGKDGTVYSVAYVADLDHGVKNILAEKAADTHLYGGTYPDFKDKTVEEIISTPYTAEHTGLVTIISK